MISSEVLEAVKRLRAGELVAFPTETVYGLGADARNEAAVQRIFAVKGRPIRHPLIVHLADVRQLTDWASEVPPEARSLAQAFMPGALTLILNRASHVLDIVTGGQSTVGLRIPSHPVARSLLEVFGDGIAAPSANRFGRISPTSAAHVRDEFGTSVETVLDGGDSQIGLESTILDLSTGTPTLLRPGAVTVSQLEAQLGRPVVPPTISSPRAPGSLETHYAAAIPTQMLPWTALVEAAGAESRHGTRVAVLSMRPMPDLLGAGIAWSQVSARPWEYAHDLYARMREIDAGGFDLILVEEVPAEGEWLAVYDRLRRAEHA